MVLVITLLASVLILFFGISAVDASLSDLDNVKPTNPLEPEDDSSAQKSDKEAPQTNDLAKPEAGLQTQDETATETSQGANATTSEKNPNLKVRPLINCDLNPSPS